VLAQYRLHEGLIARMPNYRIRMGFGLHRGKSIEGAIGSEFKVDASYLSPSVNLSADLEAGTKLYGKPMLISETVVAPMTKAYRKLLRKIDHVELSGYPDPIYLYTCDIDDINLKIYEPPEHLCDHADGKKKKKT